MDDAQPVERAAGDATSPPFRVGVVPGVMAGTWVRRWMERFPHTALELVHVPQARQLQALRGGEVDVCFVREVDDREGLHLIPLWEEQPVVVVPRGHVVTAVEELTSADLSDEGVLRDPDTPTSWESSALFDASWSAPTVPRVASTDEALDLVVAGVGVVVLPQSVARMHHRKELLTRPVTDLEPTRVGLAWPRDTARPEDVAEFVGIVRGRTANSSRSGQAHPTGDDAAAPSSARVSPAGRRPRAGDPRRAAPGRSARGSGRRPRRR